MIKKAMYLVELLFMVAVFVSCSGSEQMDAQEQEVPLCFNVSAMNVDVKPMNRAASSASGADLGSVVNKICYYIYNSSSTRLVKYGSSAYDPDGDNSKYGEIKVSLIPGSYTILFYALGKGSGKCSFLNSEMFNYDCYFDFNNKEVFLYTGDITVSSSSGSFDVDLKRKSSLLSVNITDKMPENVSKVKFTINDYCRWYPKNSGTYRAQYVYEAVSVDSQIQTFEYYFSFPEALSATSTTMVISAFDSESKLIGEKLMEIPIYANKRTVVSGMFFSSLDDRNMKITVNDSWDEDVVIPIE